MTIRVPRFAQQFFGFGNALIAWPAGVIWILQFYAADIRLANQPGRALSLPQYFFSNDVFIQRHVQRQPDSRIVKWRPGGVELIIVGRQLRRHVQLIAHGLFKLRELVNRYRINNIDFTRFIAVNVRRL